MLLKIICLCNKNNINFPNKYEITQYNLLYFEKITVKRKLVGSPFVYFNFKESILIRKMQNNKNTQNSFWCLQDHKNTQNQMIVSTSGVNFIKKCPFAKIKAQTGAFKKISFRRKHNFLLSFEINNEKQLRKIIELITTENSGIIIFPIASVESASAQLSIHSTIRMFLV